MQSITLADATPTNHVFVPTSVSGGQTMLLNRTGKTTSAGAEVLIVGLSLASAKRKTNRVNVRLAVPYEVTVDSVVQVRDVARANTDVVLPELMTSTERNHFATLLGAALAHAIIKGYSADLAPMLGS
jgi:hypothetical protein